MFNLLSIYNFIDEKSGLVDGLGDNKMNYRGVRPFLAVKNLSPLRY